MYMFGYKVPKKPKQAYKFDRINGNTKWEDVMKQEADQLIDYDTFIDKGQDARMPKGYTKIRLHWLFAVKHDGRHKARCVAGGHLTGPPVKSVYSGVVSMKELRLIIFIAEMNGLELYGADIGNAYLEAKTKEKVSEYP